MMTFIQIYPLRVLCYGLLLLTLTCFSAGIAGANPLVGQWEPAANQPNENVARNLDKLGRLEITPTHLKAFGEKPDSYDYEQDGNVFHIKVNRPKAQPVDFILRDPNTLLMRLPNDVDILWQRVGTTAPQSAATESRAASETAGSSIADVPFEMMKNMMMPHSLPTRYEMLDESLEVLLNNGWSIIQASGASPVLALVLRRGQQHVICALIGNMQDRQTGRSDCRRIN